MGGKKWAVWGNEVSGNAVTRGHCWDIHGAVPDFFFFLFWIYEEEPWQLYVVLYIVLRRVWTFPVASELLETYLCCVHLG